MYKKYVFVIFLLTIIALTSCENKSHVQDDSLDSVKTMPQDATEVNDTTIVPIDTLAQGKVYSNERFKDVAVKKVDENTFEISGKGQIFEANFGWVIEDGHNELKKGYEMTDAGAPEWGNFKFSVEAKKDRPNSSLHIILFETSAKDGSRVHELPILLY